MGTITLKMTAPQLFEVHQGIVGLDGRETEGKPGAEKPYKFSASFRIRNAKNLAKLKAELQIYEAERRKVQLDGPVPDKDGRGDPKAERESLREQNELANVVHEITLETSTEEELRLEQNPISVQTLALLWPLIEGDAE